MFQVPQVSALSHAARSAALFLWFAVRSVSAQPHESLFNELTVFSVPHTGERCVLLSSTSALAGTVAWYSPGTQEIVFGRYAIDSASLHMWRVSLPIPVDSVCSFSTSTEVHVLTVSKKTAQLSLSLLTDGELHTIQTLTVPFEPEKVYLLDFNNDGKEEILVLNKEVPGVLSYVSTNKGIFQQNHTMAPELMVSEILPVYLNNDYWVDLILYDWVQSAFHVFYGIGKGRFLDESTFPVQGDVWFLAASRKYPQRVLKIAALLKRQPVLHIWEGNELGDIRLSQILPCTSFPLQCTFTDLDGDGSDELLVLEESGTLSLFKLEKNGKFVLYNEIGVPATAKSFFVGTVLPHQKGAAFVWNKREKAFLSFFNNSFRSVLPDTLLVPLPKEPVDIVVRDVTGDDNGDIFLAHSSAKQITMFYGSENTSPRLMESYILSQKPAALQFLSHYGSFFNFVVTYPATQSLSLVELEENGSVKESIIPTEGNPTLLAPAKTAPYIGVLNEHSQSESMSLSFFESVGANTFIERTFRLASPARLLGATIADINSDGMPDILYSYSYQDSTVAQLGVAFGDSSFSFSRRVGIPQSSLPLSSRYFLWIADLDNNDTLDLLLYLGEPWYQLWCMEGNGNGMFRNPHFIAHDLKINVRNQLKLHDVNEDGKTDILVTLAEANTVLLFPSNGVCTYLPPVVLFKEEGIAQCAVADIDSDGYPELLTVFPKKHVLKILNGRVWRSLYEQ